MLTSEFNQELGSLIRSLETRVRQEPELLNSAVGSGLAGATYDHIDRAIISLVALRISLTRRDA